MKLSIVIPVYNEKDTVSEIINRVLSAKVEADKEIIIIDDGSVDGTRDVLKKLSESKPDLKIIFKENNSGKGDTLKEGFKHTSGDYVIVQDADLEYNPSDYQKLLELVKDKKNVAVYGSRFSGDYKDMTNLHFFGNKLLTMLTNLIFRVSLTDMETCYKLIPGDFARRLDIKSKRFNFEPEITAKILKSGMTIMEVPITYKGRSFSDGKKITWKDGLSAVFTLIRFRFKD